MLRTSLYFLIIAVVALMAADVSISTHDPWIELRRIGWGLLTPDFFTLPDFTEALVNTISFALLGISCAVTFGFALSLFFDHAPVRLFCAFIRSIHEIFWAFILMPLTGLNSFCGILAIAIPYAGIFAKVYAEIRQESDRQPDLALPAKTSRLSRFLYTTLPLTCRDMLNYTSYRFECALRSSAVLGFIGLPTIGYHLETAFREGLYHEAAALLYCFYLLIISVKLWARPKYIGLVFVAALMFTSWEASPSLANTIRFFTYDILPWPMRAEGYYSGTFAITFPVGDIFSWAAQILKNEALPGIYHTIVLTQLALVCTALFTLASFSFASRTFFSPALTNVSHLLLVVLRTTPEYILAYILLQLWGPSMLPALFALFLHNGAILSYLTARNVDWIELPFDTTRNRINRLFYEVLPRCYGQFLAFLFYRWEVILRESAIFGILGIATLGFYIDSAISRDHLDTALLLILVTAVLNMSIDTLSQKIRRLLHISAHLKATGTFSR